MTKSLSTLALLMTLSFSSAGQQLPKKQVYIRNADKKVVSFGLSCDDRATWRAATLNGHERQRYECDDRRAKMWIHVNTDIPDKPHLEVERAVEDGQRYELFFHKQKGQRKWDVRQL